MGPLMRFIDDPMVGMYEMGKFLSDLVAGLEDAARHPNVLLEGFHTLP